MRELKYQGKRKNYLNERKLFILFLVSLIKQLDRCRFENVENENFHENFHGTKWNKYFRKNIKTI